MNGYVEAGYIVAIGTLVGYGASLVARERRARLRLRATAHERNEQRDAARDGDAPPAPA